MFYRCYCYATLQEIFAEMDAIRLIAIMANVSITAPLLGPLLRRNLYSFFQLAIYLFLLLSASLLL